MALILKEVEEKINENYEGDYKPGGLEGLVKDMWDCGSELTYEIDGLPTIRYVACGGAEGDGAEMWLVFSVGEQLYRMHGYYSSWDSNRWDGKLVEVKAKEVMRTEYEVVV